MAREYKYYIHLCYNGKRFDCIDRYTVNEKQYVRWEDLFGEFDCFDERIGYKAAHLFLDCGDCDDPIDVTYLHDISDLVF